jgi:hypothetical protein
MVTEEELLGVFGVRARMLVLNVRPCPGPVGDSDVDCVSVWLLLLGVVGEEGVVDKVVMVLKKSIVRRARKLSVKVRK